jgi:hypothetical protein
VPIVSSIRPVINQVQAFYGRSLSIIPVTVDSITAAQDQYAPQQEGGYYRGLVPQTVLISGDGDVLLDEVGILPYETIDNSLRELFDLPAPEPGTERFRNPYDTQINEFNP